MEWMAQVDRYCERVDFSFWSEPVNALTNASFVIAAFVVWAMLGGKRDAGARVLTIILAAIGVGSFLFHTFATRWAGLADVLPIQLFILAYIFLSTTRFFGAPVWAAAVAVVAFFPYAWAVVSVLREIVGPLNGSIGYIPVPILILGYALALMGRAPDTARGLAIGACILIVSLVFRTMDEAVCTAFPLGTHFLWHTLNGIMLGWMIMVMHRHLPAPR